MSKRISGRAAGHVLASLTVLIWGVTFIASERLLTFLTTSQLLFVRFVIAFLVLFLACPKIMKPRGLKKELKFAVLSATGVIGYYFCENYAIMHGGAANTSILISCIPIVTLILMCIFGKKNRLTWKHAVGFAAAIAGVVCVVYNGAVIRLELTPGGVLGAFGACICWAAYSVLVADCSSENPVQLARRVIMWGLVFMAPYSIIKDGLPPMAPFRNIGNIAYMLILGVLGSGFCYSMWSRSIKLLGVDIATNYIYVQPFITLAAAVILGTSSFSLMSVIGAVLILVGVVISDKA